MTRIAQPSVHPGDEKTTAVGKRQVPLANGGRWRSPCSVGRDTFFARACIDAGADVVLGHGPHVLRGLEMYKERPIFYSLGNFIFQNETVQVQPSDFYEQVGLGPEAGIADGLDIRTDCGKTGFSALPEYWESVLPYITWDQGRVVEIRLFPLDLGFGLPRTMRGRPLLAEAPLAQKIIERMAALSAPFGTIIRWNRDGYGSVELA